MSHLHVVEAPVKGLRVIAPLDLGRASAMPLAPAIKDQNTKTGGGFSAAAPLRALLFRCQRGALVRKDRPSGRARERWCVGSNRRSAYRRRSLRFKDLLCYTPTTTRRHSHALWELNARVLRRTGQHRRSEIYSRAQKRANLSPALSACASFCTSSKCATPV
jgi:hypothetical protein